MKSLSELQSSSTPSAPCLIKTYQDISKTLPTPSVDLEHVLLQVAGADLGALQFLDCIWVVLQLLRLLAQLFMRPGCHNHRGIRFVAAFADHLPHLAQTLTHFTHGSHGSHGFKALTRHLARFTHTWRLELAEHSKLQPFQP